MFSRPAHPRSIGTAAASPTPPPPIPPTRCHWRWDDLLAADGNTLAAEFTASVAVLSAPAEAAMFREVFGAGPVSPAAIAAHFDAPLRHAAATLAAAQPVEAALADALRPTWLQTLRDAATRTAFTAGVELAAPFDVQISSPSLQASRAEQMQRLAAERRSADRLQQIKQAGELMSQWEQLRRSAPGASAGQLLSQVSPTSRGEVLRTLLLADADGSAPPPLWCVAGPNLVKIDGDTIATVPLPGELSALGPLRSVTAGPTGLLLGGQRGVGTVPAAGVYLDQSLQSEHGFTRAVQTGNAVYAVHRDAGVVRWTPGSAQPDRTWRPAELGGVPRHLLAVGDDLLFAVDARVLRLTAAGELTETLTAASPIAALLRSDDRLIMVSSGGAVAVYNAHRFTVHNSFDAGIGEVASAALLPWVGSARLLVAGCEGAIVGLGLDDDVVMRYTGPHASYRAVSACGDAVAGLSPDRQRVVLWHPWDGRKPTAELHVSAATRHRVADFCFAPAAPAAPAANL